jgi:methionyl-tRNA synthetase
MTKPHFYITTPIYYVNDKPHIGHAYTTTACDALARFKRLDGFDVKFLTGTDEHGMKVYQAAQKAGITAQELTDRVSVNFREMNKMMNISNDQFIRTTDEGHKKSVQAIWKKMVEAGDIYLGKYSGWYSMRDEAFFGEDELITGADGKKTAPTGAPVEWLEEESYFFKLSAWGDRLLAFYEKHPEFVQPKGRYNEVISFVKGGLQDLSISRTTFDWGVKVPGDERHVMYVWVDALTNYISAIGYPDTSAEEYKKFWPADVHVVGKDILRFHAVYWPAFLMSAELEIPKRVYAHGWWMAEGQKMSKSLGNVITPEHMIETYGVDQARYFLLREVPFGNDGDFAHASAVNRINAELANNLGNLVQRTLSMIAKNCDGKAPVPGVLEDADHELLKKAGQGLLVAVRGEMEKLQFSKAIDEIVQASTAANLYIDAQAPWGLKKTDPTRMGTVLYVLAETIRNLGLIMQPFTPVAAAKILDQTAVPEAERILSFMGAAHALKPGTPLPAPAGVFPRIMEAAA